MNLKIAWRSHVGRVRERNEDSIHIDQQAGLVVVADGMGGLLAGEEASATAVEGVVDRLARGAPDARSAEVLLNCMDEAHERVIERAQALDYLGRMGTTLLILRLDLASGAGMFAHVGDSRLYRFDEMGLTQLSKDHTVAQRMIDLGQFPADQAYRAPNRHVLTQALGLPGLYQPQCGAVEAPWTRLLLCSDGLSDMLPDHELINFMQTEPVEHCAEALEAAALAAGGKDNITLAVLDWVAT
ncbi:MAG: protein phosphatase 2C domain-containing protein [Pseudomonadota bacterium]